MKLSVDGGEQEGPQSVIFCGFREDKGPDGDGWMSVGSKITKRGVSIS